MRTRVVKGHSVLKEAFKESLKMTRKKLNEKKISDFDDKYFQKNNKKNEYARDILKGGSDLYKALKAWSGDNHLENYLKQFLRYMSLSSYIVGIYKEGEKPTKEEIQEVCKTYRAADADLDELDLLLRKEDMGIEISGLSGKTEDGRDKVKVILNAINGAKNDLREDFNDWFIDRYGIDYSELDPKGNVERNEERRWNKTDYELKRKERDYWES